MKTRSGVAGFFGVCLVVLGLMPPTLQAQDTFTVGVVPQFDARRIHSIWQPILNHLESETGYSFRLAGAPTIPNFERQFQAGGFDFAYMNPYHLIVANQAQGYLPFVRDIGRQLFGVLVVKKDSDIESIKDLDGKIIAFPAPNALGASLMMREELTDLFGIDFTPRYVKTHDSVYLNVLLGETAAGGGVQKTLNQQKQMIKDNLRVLHKTQSVAPHPLAVHPRVSDEAKAKILAALLKLGESEDGKKILAQVPMKKIGVGDMQDYAVLKTMGLERFYVSNP